MKLISANGSEMELLDTDAARAQLSSSQAAPPGTPLVLRDGAGHQLQLKVNRCYKVEGSFHIEGRWVSLSRADREWLEGALRSRPASDDADPAQPR